MSKQTEMYHGSIDEVCYCLDQTPCTEGELRAALLNAFRHIETLTARLQRLEMAGAVYGQVTTNAEVRGG